MTFQSYRSLRDFKSESIVGGLVAVAMVRELGPVLSALMVNARAGSAVAAEIGTMRVTEQIDAPKEPPRPLTGIRRFQERQIRIDSLRLR